MTIEALAKTIILQGPAEEPEKKIPAKRVTKRQLRAATKKVKPVPKKLHKQAS